VIKTQPPPPPHHWDRVKENLVKQLVLKKLKKRAGGRMNLDDFFSKVFGAKHT